MYKFLKSCLPVIIRHKLITSFHEFRYKVSIGKGCYISNVKFGHNCKVGDYSKVTSSTVGKFTYITECARIKFAKIGCYCSIGPNLRIGNGLHPSKVFVSTSPIFYSPKNELRFSYVKKPIFEGHKFTSESKKYFVEIGNDVWIGSNVTIFDGVIIGDGAIIGANSLVTKNVDAFSVVVGTPAQVVRYRFNDKEIHFLKKLEWWNKSEDWVKMHSMYFDDVENLLKNTRL
jgi:acetyltransferase-like isoleucine patch superfamily enzyme